MPTPLVAVQVGAVSFVDEAVAPVLDVLQERGGANALFLAAPTWDPRYGWSTGAWLSTARSRRARVRR